MTEVARRQHQPLFEQGKLRCPNDKILRHPNAYKAYELKEAFNRDLNVVLRCSDCGHIFSPALEPSEMQLLQEALDVN